MDTISRLQEIFVEWGELGEKFVSMEEGVRMMNQVNQEILKILDEHHIRLKKLEARLDVKYKKDEM